MRSDAWVPLIATLVAGEFTLGLLRRLLARHRPHLLSWAISLAFFTVGAAALWWGTAFGWSEASFRLYYLGGALLSVPWLALGQVQLLTSGRSARAWVLGVVGFSVVAGFIVGFAPLRPPVSGYDLPSGHDLYDTLPQILVAVSNGVGALVILAGVGLSLWRSRGGGPEVRSRATGVLLVAAGVLAAGAGGALTFVGKSSANAIGVTVGVSVIYLGFVQAQRRVGRHRG